MPTLAVTNFNVVLSVLGAWISLFGLVSYVSKDRLYLSDPLISLLAGVAFSPLAANLIRPIEYVGGSQDNVDAATLGFSRLVLGVQLVLAGVHLPSQYLRRQWRPLAILVGPVMAGMWLMTSLLVWLVVVVPFRGGTADGVGLLWALAIGACVTPTDPVLSGVIVKGRFADENIPHELQRLIVAESGANDGLGYPFLFLPLFLLKYVAAAGGGGNDNALAPGGASKAIGLWFGETWGYVVILGAVYGAAAGWVAKELLHWADRRKYVERESFLVSSIALALFIVGTGGMIGSDDVLACFVAGNVFTWDDWFRQETVDDFLQPTVDMLLNVAIFLWYGAVCPWDSFLHNDVVPFWRLVVLGVLVLILRRLPFVLAAHRFIPQISQGHYGDDCETSGGLRRALFVGFFGPIGVSAIFYMQIAIEFVAALGGTGDEQHESFRGLTEMLQAVVWFIAVCSIVVHGLSIPFGKMILHIPQQFRGTSWGQGFSRTSTLAILAPSSGLPITAPSTTGRPSSRDE